MRTEGSRGRFLCSRLLSGRMRTESVDRELWQRSGLAEPAFEEREP